jgi:hypothetical protein
MTFQEVCICCKVDCPVLAIRSFLHLRARFSNKECASSFPFETLSSCLTLGKWVVLNSGHYLQFLLWIIFLFYCCEFRHQFLTPHIKFLFLFLFIVVLGGSTLWHLQKFLQCIKYITLEFTPSKCLHFLSPQTPFHFLDVV